MKNSVDGVKASNRKLWQSSTPPRSSPFHRGPDTLTNMNVAIFVESVDDEGEDEADVAGVVIS